MRRVRGALAAVLAFATTASAGEWSDRDLRLLASLRLVRTPPPSPSNRVADDPRAAALGQRIFFDPAFGAGAKTACATCHQPKLHFTDGRTRSVMPAGRNAPSVVGSAFGSWFTWDGRRDSIWAQALVPFEAADEIGASRTGVVRRIASDPHYRADYEAIFGALPADLAAKDLPARAGPLGDETARAAWQRIPQVRRDRIDRVYSNVGKALEAYERTLLPEDSRFDRYVDAVRAGRDSGELDAHEIAGLRLFIDPARTQCLQCHNGPQFTNGGFHNIGTGTFDGSALDFGRALGIQAVLLDVFNCTGPYSDAGPADCRELRFLSRDAHIPLEGSFKTPTLRDVAKTAPYFHDGRFATLRDVLDYYNAPPKDASHELRALALKDGELEDLERFVRALSSADPPAPARKAWSDTERSVLATLRLSALGAPPPDPGNPQGDDPRAAALGAALFADPALSRNGQISCQTCHRPDRAFSDGRARSLGLAQLRRNAPSLLDVAYQRWLFWDGRADSLWSQALAPLEHPDEMGGSRAAIVRRVAADPRLARMYQDVFGALPASGAATDGDRADLTRAFANLGKALAAHERTLRSRPSRFDAYVDAVLADRPRDAERQLDSHEVSGLALFLSGRSGCLSCHHGPLFSDGQFHNIGTGELGTANEDLGRAAGREQLRSAEFSCTSPFAGGSEGDCRHLTAMRSTEIGELMRGAFRTPGLRNLPATAPYMHDGRFGTIEEVLRYYRDPPDKARVRHELPPLSISDDEIEDLARFLRTLATPPRDK